MNKSIDRDDGMRGKPIRIAKEPGRRHAAIGTMERRIDGKAGAAHRPADRPGNELHPLKAFLFLPHMKVEVDPRAIAGEAIATSTACPSPMMMEGSGAGRAFRSRIEAIGTRLETSGKEARRSRKAF